MVEDNNMRLPENARAEEISKRFLDLASNLGGDIALYCICAVLNLPVYPKKSVPRWEDYLEFLDGLQKQESFIDGETDVETVIAEGASEQERWERDWGYGDPDSPYTAQDYKRLDGIFRMYSTRLDAAGGMDAQQEDTLRNCSRMALLRDKCIAKGDKDSAAIANTMNRMIQENLAAENLRKKDAKPIEKARVDGIIDAMQQKYGATADMTKDEFLEIFYKWCHSKGYPETVDAAEHAMLSIINTMRANNDLPDIPELPKEARLSEYEDEFAKIPNETELEVYSYLNIKRNDGKVYSDEEHRFPEDTEQDVASFSGQSSQIMRTPEAVSDWGSEGFD